MAPSCREWHGRPPARLQQLLLCSPLPRRHSEAQCWGMRPSNAFYAGQDMQPGQGDPAQAAGTPSRAGRQGLASSPLVREVAPCSALTEECRCWVQTQLCPRGGSPSCPWEVPGWGMSGLCQGGPPRSPDPSLTCPHWAAVPWGGPAGDRCGQGGPSAVSLLPGGWVGLNQRGTVPGTQPVHLGGGRGALSTHHLPGSSQGGAGGLGQLPLLASLSVRGLAASN